MGKKDGRAKPFHDFTRLRFHVNTTKTLSLNGVLLFHAQENRKEDNMAEHSDVYRKLAQDIQAMFETELGKLDYRDCSKVFGIICRENFSVAANACGRG